MFQQSTVIDLARYGLFLSDIDDLSSITRSDFSIRNAILTDIGELELIERECWDHLSVSRDEIEMRLQRFPQGQWVVERDGMVKAVLYTQRISSRSSLLHGMTFDNQGSLHRNDNTILQLLSISVKNDSIHLQIGTKLRDFVKLVAELDPSITDIVAMTRCSSTCEESTYNSYIFSNLDPTLNFHTRSGAKIIQAVANYRPDDHLNHGHAVLISYREKTFEQDILHDAANDAVIINREFIIEILVGVMPTIEDMATLLNFDNTSFMDMGFDSLQMMEIRGRLSRQLNNQNLSPTVLFDYPSVHKLVNYLNGCDDPEPVKPSNEAGRRFAICGLSCRLPGQTNLNPQSFFDFLCSPENNAITSVPEHWNSRVRHGGFLSPELAYSFDAAYFGLSAIEANEMDPAQRLLLEVGYEALADAKMLHSNGQLMENSKNRRIGVFVGMCNNDWSTLKADNPSPHTSTSTSAAIAANRLSYNLGINGPSMVIDTACSSSLTALHTACNAIACGDCDISLVAAADLMTSQVTLEVGFN
jgi:hypothetical protein